MYHVIGVPTGGSIDELKNSLNSIQGRIECSPFMYNSQLHIIVKVHHPSAHSKDSKTSKGGKYDVIGVPTSGSIAGLNSSLNSIQGRRIGSPFMYNSKLYIIVKDDHHPSAHSKGSKGSKGGKSRTKNSYKNMKKTRKRN